ncbi:MAG: MarR family winged helix-turn-helix transcriptional regulator [Chloroflexota bacterium]
MVTEVFEAASPAGELLTGASRALARLSKQLDIALAQVDLTAAQYRMLCSLEAGSALASALASRLAVSRPTVTGLVDTMLARGLIERHGDPSDRRRVTHLLTESGQRILREGDAAVSARLAMLAGVGPAAGVALALEGLMAWVPALDEYRESRRRLAAPVVAAAV